LLEGAIDLTRAMGHYLTTLQVDTLGIAAGTEMLFTRVYDKLIAREGDPRAATHLLGADSLPIQAEQALYDLAQWCREQEDLAAHLQRTPAGVLADQVAGGNAPADVSGEVWQAWRGRFQEHLDRYGHGIYHLDFAQPLPADDPTPLLQTLKVFARGDGRNPYERQRKLIEAREEAIEGVRARTGWLRRKLFDKTRGWAQTYTALREDSIFEIGLAYPALRGMLLELGRRLVQSGAIEAADDVFWLELSQLECGARALEEDSTLEDFSEEIRERKWEWRGERRATPPGQLPRKQRILGMNTDIYLPAGSEEQVGNVLKGVGCSPGQITGAARVLHGPEDFGEMQEGEILVADITTPAWTPLFALAAGIVTNVGGPLSHGSIVAREYGIPAVLGTGVATQRIQSGDRVRVDGDASQVTLLEE